MRAHRIWSETVSYPTLMDRRTLRLLRRFSIELLVAVRPWDAPVVADLSRACLDEGVSLGLWPMLADGEGRWVNVQNASKFGALIDQLLQALDPRGLVPKEIVFDLEPSMLVARALLDRRESASGVASMFRSAGDTHSFEDGQRTLARSTQALVDRGISCAAALVPLVLLDTPQGAPWQKLLGTPVDEPRWDRVSVMLYTSILEGWSKGTMRRRHALEILERASLATRARFGARGGVSLGAVGTGAFGNEPVYRGAHELAQDVGSTLASGITDITLFDLGGVLARSPAESWLAALVETDAIEAPSRNALRLRAANSLERLGTLGLARLLMRR